jgi:hypothetical protein
MDLNEITNLINKFQEKKVSHPNLSTLWINHLNAAKIFYDCTNEHAKFVLNEMNNTNDYTPEQLTVLKILN